MPEKMLMRSKKTVTRRAVLETIMMIANDVDDDCDDNDCQW